MEKQFPSNGKKVIDLFSGCGGFSLGFKLAGYDIVGHVELDPTLCEIYHANFPESRNLGNNVKDVLEANVLTWKKEIGDIDVLIGGPPCQGFSLAGKRNRYDPRNELFLDFVRIASILQPKIILMENVRLLTSMKTADNKIFPEIISEEFEAAGYEIIYKIVNMQDFGVPQFRERVFFLGARNDLKKKPLTFPASLYRPPSQKSMLNDTRPYRTFKTACSGLESLESGERSPVDPWHWAVTHPPHVIEWLKDVPEGESAHNNEDPRLRPPSGYNTTYKRIKWNEPCSTISTNFSMISGSRNVHPTNTRSLTIREAMRCQTFPDSFIFFGKLGDIRKAIGNALPPFFAKKFAVHIYKIFFKEN
ncbi:MAG: DNA cytosine methyltransferase [Candidatus Hodarchaeota archaeon]